MRITKKTLIAGVIMLPLAAVTALLVTHARVVYALQSSPVTIYQHQEGQIGSDPMTATEDRIIAINSAGDRMRQIHGKLATNYTKREITFATGIKQSIWDDAAVVSTVKYNSFEQLGTLQVGLDPATGCTKWRNGTTPPGTTDLGTVTVQGIPTRKIRITTPDGAWFDSQYAPSFGCEILAAEMSTPGGKHGVTTTDKITVGEPDVTLFQTPPGYKELTYSEADAVHMHTTVDKLMVQVGASQATIYTTKDQFYQSHRP